MFIFHIIIKKHSFQVNYITCFAMSKYNIFRSGVYFQLNIVLKFDLI